MVTLERPRTESRIVSAQKRTLAVLFARAGAILLLGLSSTSVTCACGSRQGEANHAPCASVRLDSPCNVIDVSLKALRKMKQALLQFVDGPDFPIELAESRAAIRAELASSVLDLDGGPSIGAWKLEVGDGHPTLVRYPPPIRGTSYLFHATLESSNGEWRVVNMWLERQLGPR